MKINTRAQARQIVLEFQFILLTLDTVSQPYPVGTRRPVRAFGSCQHTTTKYIYILIIKIIILFTPVQQSDQQVPPHQFQNQQQQQIYDQIPRSTNPNAFTASHMPQPQPSDFINPEASFNSSAVSSFPGQGIQSSHVQSQVDQQSHQDQNLSNVNPPHQSADHPHASNSSTNQPKTQHEEHLSDFSDFSDNSGDQADENQQKQSVLRKRKRRESGDNLGPSNIHNQDEESKDYLNASSEQHHGHHHGHPDIEDDGIDLDNYDQSLKTAKFIMKNGCCRECMKAFSKTGKSCLCQVPRLQRRATLPVNGCKYCGCKGCNPIDIRRDKRQEIKNKLKKEGKYYSKRQRLLDSDDEELMLGNEYDDWNKSKKEFGAIIQNLTHLNLYLLGVGVPIRQPSYILGRPTEFIPKGGQPEGGPGGQSQGNMGQERRGRRESE